MQKYDAENLVGVPTHSSSKYVFSWLRCNAFLESVICSAKETKGYVSGLYFDADCQHLRSRRTRTVQYRGQMSCRAYSIRNFSPFAKLYSSVKISCIERDSANGLGVGVGGGISRFFWSKRFFFERKVQCVQKFVMLSTRNKK